MVYDTPSFFVFYVPQISQIYTDLKTYAVEGLKPHHNFRHADCADDADSFIR